MAELKYGGGDVKIMYGSQEIGGTTKLEPGTILYISKAQEKGFKDVHLLSTTKNWNNLNGINIKIHDNDNFFSFYGDVNITSDDFKSLNEAKTYKIETYGIEVTVSRSIVDGEYRLNASFSYGPRTMYVCSVRAI